MALSNKFNQIIRARFPQNLIYETFNRKVIVNQYSLDLNIILKTSYTWTYSAYFIVIFYFIKTEYG